VGIVITTFPFRVVLGGGVLGLAWRLLK